MSLLILIPAILLAAAFLYLAGRIWWKSVERSVRAEAGRRWVGQTIIRSGDWVTFHGQQRQGGSLLVGRGALVLNDKELWFLMAWPRGELSIPVKSIRSVSLRQEFLGRKHPEPLLCVGYEADGGMETIAWGVPDAGAWRTALMDATRRAGVRISADPDSAAPRSAAPPPHPRG